ncbi:hypothetical protein KUC3_04880 [Alteromonas sp. KC3]|uniref:hypothetical protein n=1 Tax=unclassified Alteromonas TaxID=2614992 RepID=UPI0019237194|nr:MULTISPECIES: hypothetical protein [unclassified Alteromonas]BCO17631.1 hypothetical protein KUC3_04880 [Alteromonas sp. KC3]BCO21609.1 hypothetical protein KUC14_04780 [Alteromonas sp. KC14]
MEDYSPNKIPKSTRIFNIVWAVFLIAMCLYGFTNEALVYPGVRGSCPIELTGMPLLFFCVALLSGAVNAALTVIDHYDKRDNERSYKQMSLYLNVLSIFTTTLAFGYQFIINQESAVVIGNVS